MINRMACSLAALIGAMALTLGVVGTASAEEITGCPPATLPPQTSGVQLLPTLLIGGFVLIGAGAGIFYATRRKVDPTP